MGTLHESSLGLGKVNFPLVDYSASRREGLAGMLYWSLRRAGRETTTSLHFDRTPNHTSPFHLTPIDQILLSSSPLSITLRLLIVHCFILLNSFTSITSEHLLLELSKIAHPSTSIHIPKLIGNMASDQIDALSILVEAAAKVEEVPRPSHIKIRFKKGAVFAKMADGSAGEDIVVSPESEKKRKTTEDIDIDTDIDKHVVSNISNSCKIWTSG
jgi:hypothetical protein